MKLKPITLIVLAFLFSGVFATTLIIFNNPENKWRGYEQEWNTTDSLINLQLPESALVFVEEIYDHAKAENNGSQLIKSLIYLSKLNIAMLEDGEMQAIELFKSEIRTANAPVKNILQSMLAEVYENYLLDYYYSIYNNYDDKIQESDISTWTTKKMKGEIYDLYVSSIKDTDILKSTPVSTYKEILWKVAPEYEKLRPTLYDILAHRALDNFLSESTYLTDPAYKYSISDTIVFADNRKFAEHNFYFNDTLFGKELGLSLLQDLTRFHLMDKYPGPLVDLDIKRFKFAKTNSNHIFKDSLYLQSLKTELGKYNWFNYSPHISALIAEQYFNYGQKNIPPGENFSIAYKYCTDAINRFPNAIGTENCKKLASIISKKSGAVKVESVQIPDKPFRIYFEYRNVDTLEFRLIPVSMKQKRKFDNEDGERQIKYASELPYSKKWKQYVPNTGDFNQHGVEFMIDPLSIGSYILLAYDSSESKNFVSSVTPFQVSNLCLVSNNENGYYDNSDAESFYVVDRTSGQPIPDAKIETYETNYHYVFGYYSFHMKESYRTNTNGRFTLKSPKLHYRDHRGIIITKGGDVLDSQTEFSVDKKYKQKEYSDIQAYLFTDRSIYRPGQKIFFKGIITEETRQTPTKKILMGMPIKVNFVNSQFNNVESVELTSNEFGSFSGSFVIPTDIPPGRTVISTQYGSIIINIEEYKRPTFAVIHDPVEKAFAVNENITVTSNAIAYSGNPVSFGTVLYTVERELFVSPYKNYSSIYNYPKFLEVGTTTTNENGIFSISFNASPDSTLQYNKYRIYKYTISGSVTDISGETKNFKQVVSAGYISTLITFTIPDVIISGQLFPIDIYATNLNYFPIEAKGKISFAPLESPGRVLRERLWKAPDQWVISKEDYIKNFPNDVYSNEDDPINWKELPSVKEYYFNTAIKSADSVSSSGLTPGIYKCTLSHIDKSGEELKTSTIVRVFSEKETNLAISDKIYLDKSEIIVEPDTTVKLKINTTAENPYLMWDLSDINGTEKWEYLENKNESSVEVQIMEKHRGGTSAEVWFIKDNRFYHQEITLNVPWSNKDLSIELETFRDKLEPGKTETWKIKIRGPQGNSVAAELLASMYDASLDQFTAHQWRFINWTKYNSDSSWQADATINIAELYNEPRYISTYYTADQIYYSGINWFLTKWWRYFDGNYPYHNNSYFDMEDLNPYRVNIGDSPISNDAASIRMYDGVVAASYSTSIVKGKKEYQMIPGTQSLFGLKKNNDPLWEIDPNVYLYQKAGNLEIEPLLRQSKANPFAINTEESLNNIISRKNLQETAFFYPQLQTDSSGSAIISFTVPEALTEWKLQLLAHTKDLLHKYSEATIITQKDFMISPYFPRFLRVGDTINVTAKIQNLSDNEISGVAQLELLDAFTMLPVDAKFNNSKEPLSFNVKTKVNTAVNWQLVIPEGINAVVYVVKATNGIVSDGEQNSISVLTDKILITETFPLRSKPETTQSFLFQPLLNSGNNTDRVNNSVTLEYTSNPAWYAVQSLPYLQDYPFECAEQLFNRYYSNALAASIVLADPEIEKIFRNWEKDSISLISNLEKNADLKNILLMESPWVLQAAEETADKKRVAKLFNKTSIQLRLNSTMTLLKLHQLPSGGFTWFTGDFFADQYISQYILAGMAHLHALETPVVVDRDFKYMLSRTLQYCNRELYDNYEQLLKDNKYAEKTDTASYIPPSLMVQYYYATSYFTSNYLNVKEQIAYDFYLNHIKKFWTTYNLYEKAMIALALNRIGDKKTADLIARSLRENSILNKEGGRYWKENKGGYYWTEAPVETQAILIEVFDEILGDINGIDELKIWLIQQKQATAWKTTKATAEACYALLYKGNTLNDKTALAEIVVANSILDQNNATDAAGYFKKIWNGETITPQLGNISITTTSGIGGYGAMYWQYLDKMENISGTTSGLTVVKQLYLQKMTLTGIQLVPIDEKTVLKVGDLVITNLEFTADREMQYVHMRDLRASCFEPLNVLSSYKYLQGMGYYESTGDASSNYFISKLPKGKFTVEYEMHVTHKGTFSSGITHIQCMYAPEYTSYSKGFLIEVQ